MKAGIFYVVAFIWGALLTAGAIGGREVGWISLVLAWAPLGVLLWFQSKQANKRGAAHDELLAKAGIARGTGFDHTEDGTCIAINRQSKTLVLISRSAAKTYAYADVREWDARSERPGAIVGNSLQAVAMAASLERQAKLNTGFYVTVRDVDHPQWRVAMKAEKQRLRWMEILRQEINEGGSAAAVASL